MFKKVNILKTYQLIKNEEQNKSLSKTLKKIFLISWRSAIDGSTWRKDNIQAQEKAILINDQKRIVKFGTSSLSIISLTAKATREALSSHRVNTDSCCRLDLPALKKRLFVATLHQEGNTYRRLLTCTSKTFLEDLDRYEPSIEFWPILACVSLLLIITLLTCILDWGDLDLYNFFIVQVCSTRQAVFFTVFQSDLNFIKLWIKEINSLSIPLQYIKWTNTYWTSNIIQFDAFIKQCAQPDT